uniref:Uncharacterized protein n=1 Tax=Anguilla anguilla TaxID=7936 RepID=A0A0E9X394_ANGAN
MGCVDKVCGLPNHGTVYSPPSLRLRLLCDAAGEADPQLSHAASVSARPDSAAVPLPQGGALTLVFLSSSKQCHKCSPTVFIASAQPGTKTQPTNRLKDAEK